MVLCRGSAPPAIFRGMRKTPDPGAPSPRERTDGLPVKAWDWESGALDAFPGYIRNLLCGTTYLCAHVSSSSFPLAHCFFQTFHLTARMWVFFLSQGAFCRLESLPACCHQYLDQTPTPAQAPPLSSLFPSISAFPSEKCCRSMSPPDTACGQNFSLLYFWSTAMGFAARGALGGWGDWDAEGRAGTGSRGRWAAGRVQPPRRQGCWQECRDIGGCDSQQSSLTQLTAFLLWMDENLQSRVLLLLLGAFVPRLWGSL